MDKSPTSSINTSSVRSLLIANGIAVIGVLLFNWSLLSIMLAYWLENVIIGFYTILKIKKAEAPNPPTITINNQPIKGSARGLLIPFFMLHFGIFTLGHGVFVVAVFGFLSFLAGNNEVVPTPGSLPQIGLSILSFVSMAVALTISHGISYKTNFIGRQEYKKISPTGAMFSPYGRVVVLHIVIMGSGFLLSFIGFNKLTATFIVMLKITLDYLLHHRQHAKLLKINLPSDQQSADAH